MDNEIGDLPIPKTRAFRVMKVFIFRDTGLFKQQVQRLQLALVDVVSV